MINKISGETTISVQMCMTEIVDNPVWKFVVNGVSSSVWHPVWDSTWHPDEIIKNCINQAYCDYFKQNE